MRPATTVAVDGTSRSGSPTGEIGIVCRQQVLVVASYTRTSPAPKSRSITGDPEPLHAWPVGDACRDLRRGYDISNYRAIDATFGTLADVDELAEQAHSRDMKVMMYLVVTNTSDEDPWFV